MDRRWVAAAYLAALLTAGARARAEPLRPAATRISFDQIKEMIESQDIRDVPTLLQALPEEFRSSFTLVYDSGSLQQASRANPRAVLFGDDAAFIMTFVGDPAAVGYNDVEAIQFRAESAEFELRRIEFSPDGVLPPRISEANPSICSGCHGKVPRPIWHGYGTWPGVYGTVLDHISPDDRSDFDGFMSARPQHDRYRYLIPRPGSPASPYQEQGAFRSALFQPNNRLSKFLPRLNALRIAHRASQSRFYQSYRNGTLYWLLNCQGETRQRYETTVQSEFERAFPRAANQMLYAALEQQPESAKAIFRLEKLLTGLDDNTWNLGAFPLPGGRRYTDGLLTIDQLVAARLFKEAAAVDDELAPSYREVLFKELYEGLGYHYETDYAPGGVGDALDRLETYYDASVSQAACTVLERRFQSEAGNVFRL